MDTVGKQQPAIKAINSKDVDIEKPVNDRKRDSSTKEREIIITKPNNSDSNNTTRPNDKSHEETDKPSDTPYERSGCHSDNFIMK